MKIAKISLHCILKILGVKQKSPKHGKNGFPTGGDIEAAITCTHLYTCLKLQRRAI